MIRAALVATAALFARCAFAQTAGMLAASGNYGFAPVQPTNAAGRANGEVSAFVGSHATSGAAIQLQGNLLGDLLGPGGARGFAGFGTATGRIEPMAPGLPAPRVTRRGGAVGLEKSLWDGMTLSVAGGWTETRLPHGRYAPDLP